MVAGPAIRAKIALSAKTGITYAGGWQQWLSGSCWSVPASHITAHQEEGTTFAQMASRELDLVKPRQRDRSASARKAVGVFLDGLTLTGKGRLEMKMEYARIIGRR
jgi:hypothetical protein